MAQGSPCAAQDGATIKSRNIGVSRARATALPRAEGDQALHDGWPLYRTERGQVAFNDAMATLKATDTAAPRAEAFKGCAELHCPLRLPEIGPDGWLPAGRIWVSPAEYVLIVHSPRLRAGQTYRRRGLRSMRYFVLHEFHNSSRNTDTYDTISSHSGSVFVPLYMSKQGRDAKGRSFVTVVQVAPYDVVSVHATNHGSAGPGVEVAKNYTDALEPLQGLAGIVLSEMITKAASHLSVVNHRGAEGLPMLKAWEARRGALRARGGAMAVTLPFVPAQPQKLAAAGAHLGELITRRGVSPPIPVAERGVVPRRAIGPVMAESDAPPVLVGPIRLATRPGRAAEPALVGPIRPAVRPGTRVGAGG